MRDVQQLHLYALTIFHRFVMKEFWDIITKSAIKFSAFSAFKRFLCGGITCQLEYYYNIAHNAHSRPSFYLHIGQIKKFQIFKQNFCIRKFLKMHKTQYIAANRHCLFTQKVWGRKLHFSGSYRWKIPRQSEKSAKFHLKICYLWTKENFLSWNFADF